MTRMTTYQPTDQELIRWVGTYVNEDEVRAAGYHFGLERPDWQPVAGEVVVVHSHGRYRRGVVVKVGQVNAKVALTTPSAIDEAHRWRGGQQLTRVSGKSVPFSLVAGALGAAEMVDGSFQEDGRTVRGATWDQPDSVTMKVDQGQLDAAVAELDRRRDEAGPISDDERSRLDGERPPAPDRDADEYAAAEEQARATAEREGYQDDEETWSRAGDQALIYRHAAGSQVVTALERVWDAVRANHSDLPELVMVTGSGWVGSPRWGHTRRAGWVDRHTQETRDGATANLNLAEMFVAGETLAKGAAFTLETILHEAAHVLAIVRQVQDTSRQKRWHNERFRKLAEELGLEYAKDRAHPAVGYSECLLTPGTREEYAAVIEQLDRAIRLVVDLPGFLVQPGGDEPAAGGEFVHHGGRKPRGEGAGSSTNLLRATCLCPEPRIIRVSRRVLERAAISCGLCGAGFSVRDEPSEGTE